MGVERQRQDNVQTGDKVEVKQTLIPSSPSPPPPPSFRKKNTHTQTQTALDDRHELLHFR